MIGADNVLAKGDGGTIKHGQLPLRQENVGNVGARWDGKMSEMSEQWRSNMGWENVGNVGAMAEQDGMGKCRKCRSKVGARWIGKTSEQRSKVFSNVCLIKAVCALLDFLYLAQYLIHTNETLVLLEEALEQFHKNKNISLIFAFTRLSRSPNFISQSITLNSSSCTILWTTSILNIWNNFTFTWLKMLMQ